MTSSDRRNAQNVGGRKHRKDERNGLREKMNERNKGKRKNKPARRKRKTNKEREREKQIRVSE